MLGGSFFCSRTDEAALRNIRRVVPTLALLLARQSKEFSRALADEIDRDKDARHKDGKAQVKPLLCTPLLALKNSRKSVVLVIDALDECGDSTSGLDKKSNMIVSEMLEALVTFSSSSVDLPVRFLVTSRPETQIRDTPVSDAALSHILRLQAFSEDEVNEVNADIKQYITETIHTKLSGNQTLQEMMTPSEIDCLVELSDGLFIFAATALDYIFERGNCAAVARFKELLNDSRNGLNAPAAAPLDRMYQHILAEAVDADDHGSTGRTAVLRILAAILSTQMILSVAALAALLGLKTYNVEASLSRLHAVVNVPDDNDVPGLCTVHASFGDYLFDRALEGFIVPRIRGHEILAHGCLRFMGEHLRLNVPQSPLSDDSNPITQPDNITLSLQYACLHWADHAIFLYDVQGTEPQTLRRVFASALVARTELSVAALANLLNIEPCVVRAILSHHHALVNVPEDNDMPGLYTLHASFGEQRLDQTPGYIQDIQSTGHDELARGCLDVIGKHLRFNDPQNFSSYEAQPTSKLDSINLSLHYAYLHWADHIWTDASKFHDVQRLLASIISARMPLSVQALADLLLVQPEHVRASLSRLHVVVQVPADDNVPGLQMVHPLFGAYLFDRAPERIRIARSLGHDALAHGCLDMMSKKLRFNVSRSPSSYEPNGSSKPDIITLSLDYACLHWAHHIAALQPGDNVGPKVPTHDVEINQKFRSKFMFWLEVLSILRKVDHASELLLIAGSNVKDPSLSQFLRDANSFVISSREAIERSAPHIYVSALPFADKASLIYRDFARHCIGLVAIDTFDIGQHGGGTVMTLTGHKGAVRSVAYSPNGLLLASGSEDGMVRVWNTQTGGDALSTLQSGDGWVISLDFARNNEWVASGTQGGVVCIWNVTSDQSPHRRLIGHSDPVTSVAFAPDCSQLASASTDHTVRLWNTKTGEQLILSGHTDKVYGVAFSPDGSFLVSSSSDRTIRQWDSITGKEVCEPIEDVGLGGVDIASDGDMIAGCSLGGVTLWRRKTGERIANPQDASDIHCIRFSPDGRSLVVAHAHEVRVWTLQPDLATAPWVGFQGHSGDVRSATFSPDGRYIASASNDGTIRIWSTESSQCVVQPLHRHSSPVRSVAVSYGDIIASGSDDEFVRVWDARTGEETLPPLRGHTNRVLSVSISPDGDIIASASQDRSIRFWNSLTGTAVGEPRSDHTDNITALMFSPNAFWLASASDDKTVRLWKVPRINLSWSARLLQRVARVLHPDQLLRCHDRAQAVAFSRDGSTVAGGDGSGRIYFWQVLTGLEVHVLLHEKEVSVLSLAFSQNGAQIVSCGSDDVARIWDIKAGQLVGVLEGHTSLVRSAAWSVDGRYIATGSDDTTVRLWNPITGSRIATFHGHDKAVTSVAFISDGQFIVSGSEDTTIRAWNVAATSMSVEEPGISPVSLLASATLKDGWLVGSSGELILWVPAKYRKYLSSAVSSPVIGWRRLAIEVRYPGIRAGSNWNLCWKRREDPTDW